MRLKTGRLSSRFIRSHRVPGYYPDGRGLYLQISPTGSKSWIYRYCLRGRAREMGVGSVQLVDLDEARRRSQVCRQLRANGLDPIEARREQGNRSPFDHLGRLVSAKPADGQSGHRADLPCEQMAGFMKALQSQEGAAARVLEFMILTASSLKNVARLKIDNVNLESGIWTVQDSGAGNAACRIHLSPRAFQLVCEQPLCGNGIVFCESGSGKPIEGTALLELLAHMNRSDLSVRGFRSTFRHWAASYAGCSPAMLKRMLWRGTIRLAPTPSDENQRFEDIRRLLNQWALFCTGGVRFTA